MESISVRNKVLVMYHARQEGTFEGVLAAQDWQWIKDFNSSNGTKMYPHTFPNPTVCILHNQDLAAMGVSNGQKPDFGSTIEETLGAQTQTSFFWANMTKLDADIFKRETINPPKM